MQLHHAPARGANGLVIEGTAGLSVRSLALAALNRIITDGISFDEVIDAMPEMARLDPRDRGFVMTLVLTTLRHKGEAEAVVEVFLSRPLPKKSGIAPLILTLGAVQLLFLDQPPHAVIDLAVHLAKCNAQALHFSGLINAVLRKVAEKGKTVLDGLDGPRLNTPDWLWSRWSRAYGVEIAGRIAEAHMAEPALDLTVPKDTARWAALLAGEILPTGTVRLGKAQGSVENLPGYAEGSWWVQDAASAMPVRLLGALAGKSAIDLCAAPGGKTLQLCAAGARVTALDSSGPRLERLRGNLKRTGFEAEVIVADALNYEPDVQFDAVLLDAPCSATGTIRRHPDLPYLKSAAQMGAQLSLQARLLRQAAGLVKPGGMLVYCTCSLEPAEGERQITTFLPSHPEFTVAPILAGECGIETPMITVSGCLRTLPHMAIGASQGLDGFFAARLTKTF